MSAFLTDRIAALESYFCDATGAEKVELLNIEQLFGGAIQENWRLTLKAEGGSLNGLHDLVLRQDAPSAIAASLSRSEEFRLLQVAFEVGVTVPEPYFHCADPLVIGTPFFVMRWCSGTAQGHSIVKPDGPGRDKVALAQRLGRELALIHKIRPPQDNLEFLGTPSEAPAEMAIRTYRAQLDNLGEKRLAIEWGLRWCECQLVDLGESAESVLIHNDFRTGNYLVDDDGLTAILDWEFCAWGDPTTDIAWFCSRFWRFGQDALEAGGIADRAIFYRSYEAHSGRTIEPKRVAFWEVMANVRWAVVALQQTNRFLVGGERSLTLALTGRILPEVEHEILRLTAPGEGS